MSFYLVGGLGLETSIWVSACVVCNLVDRDKDGRGMHMKMVNKGWMPMEKIEYRSIKWGFNG